MGNVETSMLGGFFQGFARLILVGHLSLMFWSSSSGQGLV